MPKRRADTRQPSPNGLIVPIVATFVAAGWACALILTGSYLYAPAAGVAGLIIVAVGYMWTQVVQTRRAERAAEEPAAVINVRKALWGWRVQRRWCPTVRLRDREIRRVKERTGVQEIRTPG